MTGFLLLGSIAVANLVMVIVFYWRAIKHSRILPSGLSQFWLKSNEICALRYGKRRKIAAWILFAIVEGYPIVQILSDWTMFNDLSPDGLTLFTALAISISGLGWFYLLEVYGMSHLVTHVGLVRRSPFFRAILIQWADIDRITFNSLIGNFVVRSRVGRIAISPVVLGLESFARNLIEHVPQEKYSSAKNHVNLALSGPFQP